jgi:hypothetical protein
MASKILCVGMHCALLALLLIFECGKLFMFTVIIGNPLLLLFVKSDGTNKNCTVF